MWDLKLSRLLAFKVERANEFLQVSSLKKKFWFFILTLLLSSPRLESGVRAKTCPGVCRKRSFFSVKKNYKNRQQEVNSSP